MNACVYDSTVVSATWQQEKETLIGRVILMAVDLDQSRFRSWLGRFVKLLYVLPVYCATRALFDWKTLVHAAHPWSAWAGIVIQGLFFTLFFSLTL